MLGRLRLRRQEGRGGGVQVCFRRGSLLIVTAAAVGVSSSPAAAAPPSSGIPGYGYELVSPPSTAGQEPLAEAIGGTGEDVMLASNGGFVDVDNLVSFGTVYRARRTESGWVTTALGGPPAAEYPFYSGTDGDWQEDWWRQDRPQTLWSVVPKSASGALRTIASGYKHGPWTEITPLLGQDALIKATSADFSGVLVTARVSAKPTLTDGTTDARTTGETLAVIKRNPDGTFDVRQVARDNGGATLHPTCGLNLGGTAGGVLRGSVNRRGLSRIVFTTGGAGACATAARRRVYVAEPFGPSPGAVDISASRCTLGAPACGNAAAVTFVGGAKDASRVFMTTSQRLLDEDVHSGADLYEYDFRREPVDRLQLVSSGPTPPQVQGVVAVSDSGSHVYFVANGVLDHSEDDSGEPQEGSRNLYVRIQGAVGEPARTRFVATLDPGDSNLWAFANFAQTAITPDGRFLAFTSVGQLTAGDQDPMRDVYRYDAETGDLGRVWPDDPAFNGPNRTAESTMRTTGWGAAIANYGRNASSPLPSMADDGSAIGFATSEAMVPGDVNDADDAFVWTAETDSVSMISDGKDARGVLHAGMSADGTTHLFSTVSRITYEHVASSVGLYAYRRGGGFPEPQGPPEPCVPAVNCQTDTPTPPGPGGPVGTSTFAGPGNVLTASPKPASRIRVSKVKTVRGTSTRVTVRVPGKGRLEVSGRGLARSSAKVSKEGSYRVAVKLSARSRSILRRKDVVKVRASIRFVPEGGKSIVKRVPVTFRSKATKRTSSSRSTRTPNVQSSAVQKGR